jgi:hypothetical protein
MQRYNHIIVSNLSDLNQISKDAMQAAIANDLEKLKFLLECRFKDGYRPFIDLLRTMSDLDLLMICYGAKQIENDKNKKINQIKFMRCLLGNAALYNASAVVQFLLDSPDYRMWIYVNEKFIEEYLNKFSASQKTQMEVILCSPEMPTEVLKIINTMTRTISPFHNENIETPCTKMLMQACMRNVIYSSYRDRDDELDDDEYEQSDFYKFRICSLERIVSLNKLLEQLDFISSEKYRKEIKYMCAMSIILYCDQYKKINDHDTDYRDRGNARINVLHQFLPFLETSGIKEYLKFYKTHQLAIRKIAHDNSHTMDIGIFSSEKVKKYINVGKILCDFAYSREDINRIKDTFEKIKKTIIDQINLSAMGAEFIDSINDHAICADYIDISHVSIIGHEYNDANTVKGTISGTIKGINVSVRGTFNQSQMNIDNDIQPEIFITMRDVLSSTERKMVYGKISEAIQRIGEVNIFEYLLRLQVILSEACNSYVFSKNACQISILKLIHYLEAATNKLYFIEVGASCCLVAPRFNAILFHFNNRDAAYAKENQNQENPSTPTPNKPRV